MTKEQEIAKQLVELLQEQLKEVISKPYRVHNYKKSIETGVYSHTSREVSRIIELIDSIFLYFNLDNNG